MKGMDSFLKICFSCVYLGVCEDMHISVGTHS